MTDSEQCYSCTKHLPGGGGANRGGWGRVGGVTFSFLWATCYILIITILKTYGGALAFWISFISRSEEGRSNLLFCAPATSTLPSWAEIRGVWADEEIGVKSMSKQSNSSNNNVDSLCYLRVLKSLLWSQHHWFINLFSLTLWLSLFSEYGFALLPGMGNKGFWWILGQARSYSTMM